MQARARIRTCDASHFPSVVEVTSDPVMRGTDGRGAVRHHAGRSSGLERARQAEEVRQHGGKEGYAEGAGRQEGEWLEGRSDPRHEEGDEEGGEEDGEVKRRQAPDDSDSFRNGLG